jgi:hypothetical protein
LAFASIIFITFLNQFPDAGRQFFISRLHFHFRLSGRRAAAEEGEEGGNFTKTICWVVLAVPLHFMFSLPAIK